MLIAITVYWTLQSYIDSVAEDTMFEKSYLSKDLALLTDTIYSSPGEVRYLYTNDKAELNKFEFEFSNQKVSVSEVKAKEKLKGTYPFGQDMNLEFKTNLFYEPQKLTFSKTNKRLELGQDLVIPKKDEVTLFKEQYSDLKNKFREKELKAHESPCILGVFENIEIPESYQLVIDVKPVDFSKKEVPEGEYEIYYADKLGRIVSTNLIEPIEGMNFIVSSTTTSFKEIVPKIVLTHNKILVYDENNNKRAEGLLTEVALVIARHDGKDYWSTDNINNPVKPFCYATIKEQKTQINTDLAY